QCPAMAWTGLNNTVVVGSLALGLWLFYPVYFLTSRSVMRLQKRYGARLSGRLKKYRLYQVLLGADLSTGWSWQR
ncbi:MAG TPA: hypothetical protein PLF81_23670, partial [Candidatus Anammoximicrobium sp.]|nr:hypothetical protein [Candidatus Anammoximicrobium sp.]